jgi:hypothetical protein
MRGFAISSLIPLRTASAASLFKLFLGMIDHCTLLIRVMVNRAHAPMLLSTQADEFEDYVRGLTWDDSVHTPLLRSGD